MEGTVEEYTRTVVSNGGGLHRGRSNVLWSDRVRAGQGMREWRWERKKKGLSIPGMHM